IPGVKIQIMRRDTDVTLTATSDEQGRFGFQLLAPGNYGLQAVMQSFDPLQLADINISVPETLRIELHLHLAAVAQHVEVRSELPMVQTEDSALGRVVYGAALTGLPLVTRNYAQIAGLSPGGHFRGLQRWGAWSWRNCTFADQQVQRWNLRSRGALLQQRLPIGWH